METLQEEQKEFLEFVRDTNFTYNFQNVMTLSRDFDKGVFNEVSGSQTVRSTNSDEIHLNGAEMKNHDHKSRYGISSFDSINRERRQKEAVQRNRDWQSMSLLEQLAELDNRFGKGVGAIKQRTKIQNMIDAGYTYNPNKEKINADNERKQAPRNAKSTQGAKKPA